MPLIKQQTTRSIFSNRKMKCQICSTISYVTIRSQIALTIHIHVTKWIVINWRKKKKKIRRKVLGELMNNLRTKRLIDLLNIFLIGMKMSKDCEVIWEENINSKLVKHVRQRLCVSQNVENLLKQLPKVCWIIWKEKINAGILAN